MRSNVTKLDLTGPNWFNSQKIGPNWIKQELFRFNWINPDQNG